MSNDDDDNDYDDNDRDSTTQRKWIEANGEDDENKQKRYKVANLIS